MTINRRRAESAIEGMRSIEITFQVSPGLIRDVMQIALEGGINYWAAVSNIITTPVPHGLDDGMIENEVIGFTVTDAEDPVRAQSLDVTALEVLDGIELILGHKVQVSENIRGYIRNAVVDDDASSIDAVAADVIIQAGLFGEIVYG